jgi:hypothetical protein
MQRSWIDRLRQVDEQRPSFPGEHWLVATAGIWLLRRKGLLGKAAGAAMLYRAASGRDGLRRLLGSGGPGASYRPAMQGRMQGAGGGLQRDDMLSPADRTGAPGRRFAPEDAGVFPERGAGSSYEPRGNPATSGYPDFR